MKDVVVWRCTCCKRECIPVREQSRCMCGHRLKDHPKDDRGRLACANNNCRCRGFFYIVAEGAWVLRCSCKHKHTDHDPQTRRCSKARCGCTKFFSPWVCNCDHPWSQHEQLVEQRPVRTLEEMLVGGELAIGGDEVLRTDLLKEPLRL